MPSKPLSFWVDGHIPSKSNTRYARNDDAARKRRYLKDYQHTVAQLAMVHGGKKRPQDTPVCVHLVGFGQRTDPDNWFKVILDGMEGVCYENDRQVIRGAWDAISKEHAGGRHGVQITVTWLSP